MKRRRISTALAGVAMTCALGAAVWPHARDAGLLLAAQDDPAALAETQVSSALRNNQKIVSDNVEQALAKGDADLAASFVELARANDVAVSDDLSRQVSEAVAQEKSTSHFAKQFATGFVTGNSEDVASLSGTITGDLFVFGDVRDVVRETKHLAMGEETDRLVLGLATAGLAVTAATYVTAGGAVPVRAGLSLVKGARKVGRLGEGLAEWAGRSAREVVDTPALEEAVASSSVLRPGDSVNAIKAAFRAEKAGALVRLAKDVGRITERAGTRGALDTLKIAEGPKDVSRAARLAEAEGGKTRAILKILGRGALLLAGGVFDLALWVLSALLALFSLLATIKSMTERATQAWLDHGKARRLRKQLAAAKAEAEARVAIAAA
jgi:ATP-dependent protease HslVU (ClpYQ) peptidase subunit